MVLLESLLDVRSVPGQISLNRLFQNSKLVGRPLKVRCRSELPGNAASWISLRVVFFIKYKSFSPFICIHVLATSLFLGANKERPVRLGREDISTGVESESQIRLQKAIVRRRLAPLSKGRDCKERYSLYQF